MSHSCNNTKELSLNDKELAIIEGYNLAANGASLEDSIANEVDANRVSGIKEGFHKYNAKSLSDSVKKYADSPNPITFKAVVDSLSKFPSMKNLYLQGLAVLNLKTKVSDDFQNITIEYWLNRLLAEEFQAWYQYIINEKFLKGDERPHIQEAFHNYAQDELSDHADALMQRMHDLGCTETWLEGSPNSWEDYAASPYHSTGLSIDNALNVMIASEEGAIASYNQAVEFALSVNDHVSADLFKRILAEEQEHYAALRHFQNDRMC